MTLNRMLDGLVHNLEFHGPGGKCFIFVYLCPTDEEFAFENCV